MKVAASKPQQITPTPPPGLADLIRGKDGPLEGTLPRRGCEPRRVQYPKATVQTQIAEWVAKLYPADYDIEGILATLNNLAEVLSQGTPGQQKRTINAAFERIEVGLDGGNKKGRTTTVVSAYLS